MKFLRLSGLSLSGFGLVALLIFGVSTVFAAGPLGAGDFDPTFGTAGVTIAGIGGADTGFAVALQADGKIVVAGTTRATANSTSDDFAVARFNTDGSPDTSFGTDGITTTDFAGFGDSGSDVTIQADGKIVVAETSGGDIALARYLTDGTLDTGFGTGGRVYTDFLGGTSYGNSVVVQSDGKLVVAGQDDGDFLVIRLLAAAPTATPTPAPTSVPGVGTWALVGTALALVVLASDRRLRP